MSKKHFIALADTLSEIRRRINFRSEGAMDKTITATEAIAIVENELCRFCSSQNSRFMWDRFIEYSKGECGPNGGSIRK